MVIRLLITQLMKISTKHQRNSRREFLTRSLPACALSMCALSCMGAAGSMLYGRSYAQDEIHKFDKEYEFSRAPTLRDLSRMRNSQYINFCKYLTNELGEEKGIDIIRDFSDKRSEEIGMWVAKRDSDNSFTNFTKVFKSPQMMDTLAMEILEDTDTAFEVRITECLSYEIYKESKCDGNLGYACVCHGDHGFARGYNPKIKMIRDKTLMEGDAYCNHRYIMET